MNKLDLSTAPECGYCLAYLVDDSVVLDVYKIEDGYIKLSNHENLDLKQITKCHLFNDKVEYRAMHLSASNEDIVAVLTENEEKSIDPLCLKEQVIYLDDKYKVDSKKWIRIVNRFNFNEDNCIYLENYRLAGLI